MCSGWPSRSSGVPRAPIHISSICPMPRGRSGPPSSSSFSLSCSSGWRRVLPSGPSTPPRCPCSSVSGSFNDERHGAGARAGLLILLVFFTGLLTRGDDKRRVGVLAAVGLVVLLGLSFRAEPGAVLFGGT